MADERKIPTKKMLSHHSGRVKTPQPKQVVPKPKDTIGTTEPKPSSEATPVSNPQNLNKMRIVSFMLKNTSGRGQANNASGDNEEYDEEI